MSEFYTGMILGLIVACIALAPVILYVGFLFVSWKRVAIAAWQISAAWRQKAKKLAADADA